MSSAIVVGSGPNGLAAAARLARAGLDVTVLEASDTIGGGTRSSEMIVPGLVHDHCSAFHPIAAASPFLTGLDLASDGLTWLQPAVDCAHPLDDGSAGVLYRSIERTVDGMGRDGQRWRRVFAPMVSRFDNLFADASQPVVRVPRHPLTLARFGTAAMLPATALAGLWRTEAVRALWAGVAAHAYYRLDRPMTSAIGLMLIVAGHAKGWVVAEGGSQAIANALAADIERHGGKIETGQLVTSLDDLPPSDVLMLDVSPSIAADILGDRLPSRVARSYRRFRHGPAAFKVDFAVAEGVPWTAPAARQAGTVHLGGDLDEVVASRAGGSPREDARAAVRARRPAVSRRPDPVGGQHPPGVDVCARAIRLFGRCDRGDHLPDRAFRPRVPRADRRHGGALRHGDVGLQHQLRRWRRHRRVVVAGTARVPTTTRRRPLLHGDPRDLPVFGIDATRGGSARNVRRQRRRSCPGTVGVPVETSFGSGRESAAGSDEVGPAR